MLRKRLNKHIYWNRLLPIIWIKMTAIGRRGRGTDGGVKIGKSENPGIFIGKILGLLGYRQLTMSGISGNWPLMNVCVCARRCTRQTFFEFVGNSYSGRSRMGKKPSLEPVWNAKYLCNTSTKKKAMSFKFPMGYSRHFQPNIVYQNEWHNAGFIAAACHESSKCAMWGQRVV